MVYDGIMPATEAPFYESGSLANYPNNYSSYPLFGTKMHPIVPFTAEMKLIDYTKGRSAVNFIFKDLETGRTYPMFLTDFYKIARDDILKNGILSKRQWTIVKRGANYGIVPA
jgi:hypothetical protein